MSLLITSYHTQRCHRKLDFALAILSFCVKLQMRANDCFKISQSLKHKLTPSFLPYEPLVDLPVLGIAAKRMQILCCA